MIKRALLGIGGTPFLLGVVSRPEFLDGPSPPVIDGENAIVGRNQEPRPV